MNPNNDSQHIDTWIYAVLAILAMPLLWIAGYISKTFGIDPDTAIAITALALFTPIVLAAWYYTFKRKPNDVDRS